jgi:hypothetical protein
MSVIGEQFATLLEEELYEDELYFISQMFEEDWRPRDTAIDYQEGTLYDVPLKKYGTD